MTTVEGTVVSGRGICRTVVTEHNQELENLVGVALYPGSLNVVLGQPVRLDETTACKFDHDERLLWPASIGGLDVWLYRWRTAPLHVLEIVAPTHLRTTLGINTGSTVRISISDRLIRRVAVVSRLAWAAIYAGRLDWWYSHDRYSNKTHHVCVALGATQVEYSGTPTAVWKLAKKSGKKIPFLRRAVRAGRRLYSRNENDEYRFDRLSVQNELVGRSRSLASIYTLLSYTKVSNSAYSAIQYPAAYHSVEIEGELIRGQRNPLERLSKVPFDFSRKSVLDIGSNQGGMLINLGDKIKWGVGIDGDSRLVNVANRIAWAKGEDNLRFFAFNLEKEPLSLIQDFLPDEQADICFLLSVCMWLTNWRSVMDAAQLLAPCMLFESNGTEAQQAEQEAYLRKKYQNVLLVSAQSDDDPGQKKRRLFLAEGRV